MCIRYLKSFHDHAILNTTQGYNLLEECKKNKGGLEDRCTGKARMRFFCHDVGGDLALPPAHSRWLGVTVRMPNQSRAVASLMMFQFPSTILAYVLRILHHWSLDWLFDGESLT
jgi:hypothetical protein